MSVGSFLGMCTKKLLDAEGHLEGPAKSDIGLWAKGHSPSVCPQAKSFVGFISCTPEDSREWLRFGAGTERALKGQTKPHTDLSTPHLLPLPCSGLCQQGSPQSMAVSTSPLP